MMDNENRMPDIPENPNYEITDDLVDHYWSIINYINTLIRASEIKAGIILSFYGILLNFFYQYLNEFLEMAQSDKFIIVFMVCWFILTVTSIFFSFKCFMPMILNKYDKNVFFFGDVIASFGDIKSYARHLYKVSNDKENLFLQLGEQVYINSKIAALKFKYVNKSIQVLAINITLIFIFSIIYSIRSYV